MHHGHHTCTSLQVHQPQQLHAQQTPWGPGQVFSCSSWGGAGHTLVPSMIELKVYDRHTATVAAYTLQVPPPLYCVPCCCRSVPVRQGDVAEATSAADVADTVAGST